MKKKATKKLLLAKETVANLKSDELRQAAGGTLYNTECYGCYSANGCYTPNTCGTRLC